MTDEDDIEFIEPDEGFNYGKGEAFSHPQLVMITQKKCIDAGCREMRQGYYNEKLDKFGNNIITYVPDTRKEFIECVKTLKMVMSSDLDGEVEKQLESIDKELKEVREKYCKMEKEQWEKANTPMQTYWQRQGIFFREGMLHEKFPYIVECLIDEVSIHRKVFSILDKQAKKLGYYKEGIREA